MTRKINPRSSRFGLIQLWSITIQNYGNNFLIFTKFYFNYKRIIASVTKFFFKYQTIVFFQEIIFSNQLMLLNLGVYKINKPLLLNYFYTLSKIFNLINFWTKQTNIRINFYFWNSNQFFCSVTLVNYATYLIVVLNYSPKKVLSILIITLTQQLNHLNIFYCKNGPINSLLKGFKIQWDGCFENTKIQMSEKLEYKLGLLSLTTFNNQVDFSKKVIYSKLGSLNLKIWLFFKIF